MRRLAARRSSSRSFRSAPLSQKILTCGNKYSHYYQCSREREDSSWKRYLTVFTDRFPVAGLSLHVLSLLRSSKPMTLFCYLAVFSVPLVCYLQYSLCSYVSWHHPLYHCVTCSILCIHVWPGSILCIPVLHLELSSISLCYREVTSVSLCIWQYSLYLYAAWHYLTYRCVTRQIPLCPSVTWQNTLYIWVTWQYPLYPCITWQHPLFHYLPGSILYFTILPGSILYFTILPGSILYFTILPGSILYGRLVPPPPGEGPHRYRSECGGGGPSHPSGYWNTNHLCDSPQKASGTEGPVSRREVKCQEIGQWGKGGGAGAWNPKYVSKQRSPVHTLTLAAYRNK